MKKVLIFIAAGFFIFLIAAIITFQYSRSWERSFFIDPLNKINTNEKVVALTFDDGPSERRTPVLLELLGKYGVKATFFMVGENIEKYPDVAKAVCSQGHLIGNHSYNHPRLIFKTPSFIRDQIQRTDILINRTGQERVQYFRPPYSSKYFILPFVLRSLDKILVTGTYDPPSEYISPYNAKKVAEEVIKHAKPGSIIYLHDGKNTDREQFVRSIELIIINLKNDGYKFVRLDYDNGYAVNKTRATDGAGGCM